VPAGIKLIRIDRKSGMRAGGEGGNTILEAYKPALRRRTAIRSLAR